MSRPAPPVDAGFDRSRLSLLERVLRVFTDVHPGEGPTALRLFATVFLILTAYYLLKPLREGWLAVSDVGQLSKVEIKAYTSFGQTLLLVGVAATYGRLVGRWPRAQLIERTTLFCIANIGAFFLLQPDLIVGHVPAIGILYYLWVGMFGVFVVAQFWAFAADLYSEERGRRLLPLIAIGATSGAIVGSWLEKALPEAGLHPQYLLLASIPPLVASMWLTRRADAAAETKLRPAAAPGRPEDGRGALALVLRTRFLAAVAVITLLSNWVKTNGENQLFAAVQDSLSAAVASQGIAGEDEVRAFVRAGTTAFYSDFFFWVNALALGLQALVASRLLRLGGFGAIFLLLPTIAVAGYAAIAALPALWLMKIVKVAENATDYSINNTARHVLWLPMSQEVTFKAKPTIDSLFFRAGDGLAALTVLVGVQLLSWPVRSFFGLNVALAAVAITAAVWVVREFARMSGDAPPQPRSGSRADRHADPRPAFGGGS